MATKRSSRRQRRTARTGQSADTAEARTPPTDDPGGDALKADLADKKPTPNSAVNKQILDAVQASTEYAFGLNNQLQTDAGSDRLSAGVAMAYDKAAQAAALGVQDATDYERNVLSISSAAQGKALAMILAGDNVPDAAIAFVLSLISSVVAPIVVYEVGEAQTNMLNGFPQG